MTYLITQTFVLLLIAGLLGLLLGWYLTRLSGANAQATLQMRVRKAEEQQRAMRAERDAAVTARDSAENERRLQSDELNRLRALHDGDSSEVSGLEAELARLEDENRRMRAKLDAAEVQISEAGFTDDIDERLQNLRSILAELGKAPEQLFAEAYEAIAARAAAVSKGEAAGSSSGRSRQRGPTRTACTRPTRNDTVTKRPALERGWCSPTKSCCGEGRSPAQTAFQRRPAVHIENFSAMEVFPDPDHAGDPFAEPGGITGQYGGIECAGRGS